MNRAIFVAILVILVCGEFQNNRKLTLPSGTVYDMHYTNDHKYLIIITQTQNGIHIYNGFTALKLNSIAYPAQFVPETFQISQDNQYVAVGSNQGAVKVYQLVDGNLSELKTYSSSSTSKINGLDFSPDTKILAVTQFDGHIDVWNWEKEDTPTVNTNFGNDAFALVWSPADDSQFWVGGGSVNGEKLAIYQIQKDNVTAIGVQEKQTLPNANQNIEDLTVVLTPANQGKIYRVGASQFIYIYDAADPASVSQYDLTNQYTSISKIEVSDDESFIGLAVTGGSNILGGSVVDQTLTVTAFPTNAQAFALSSSGANLVVPTLATEADIKGECAEGQYYDSTQKQCLTCASGCTLCYGADTTCQECTQRFYLNAEKCLKCSSGCKVCTDGNTCTECRTQDNFQPDGAGACKCVDGKYDLNDNCADCINGCQVCENNINCTTCWAERNFKPQGDGCTCQDRFYQQDDNCLNCFRGCFTCRDDQSCDQCDAQNHYVASDNNCICDDDGNFEDNGTNCVCKAGFYEDASVCTTCPMGCVTCSSATQCIDCDPDKAKRQGEGLCKCPIGQYIDGSDQCQQCSQAINFCQECDVSTSCLKCQDGLNREVDAQGQCGCIEKFFQENDVCVACGMNGCLRCSSTSVCTTCDANENWEPNPDNQQCKCVKKFVEIANVCENCNKGCDVCGTDKVCSQCATGENWEDDGQGGCQCMKAFYEDNLQCLACMVGCTNCTTKDVCTNCNTEQHFVRNSTNQCHCSDTYYLKTQVCELCSVAIPRCNTCRYDGAVCNSCKGPFKKKGDRQCGCEDGKYADDSQNTCLNCPEECTKCESVNKCTDCADGYDIDDGKCVGDGLDTLVIVMIVVGALAVAGAGFAIFKCIRKKRSPLEQEGYESMESMK